MAVDEARVEEMVGQLAGLMTGAMLCLAIWLGDELGYYRALAGGGAVGADDLAARLDATRGSPASGSMVRPRQGCWRTTQRRPVLDVGGGRPARRRVDADVHGRGMNSIIAMASDGEKLRDAFQGDGGMSWGEHHPCLFCGTEWFFRPGYRAFLTAEWIPALDGVEQQLQDGARVADIGCGHGASVVVMADAYPNSTFYGFDFHAPSIETSRQRAAEAGVADRTEFEVATATGTRGRST